MSHIVSWSGGKDSCTAFYKAMLAGYDISHLVSLVSAEYGRVNFHGPIFSEPIEIVEARTIAGDRCRFLDTRKYGLVRSAAPQSLRPEVKG